MIVRQITGPSEKAAVSQAVPEALRGWFEMDESRENYIRERAGLPFFAAYDSESPVGCTAPAMICVLTQRIFAYRDRCFHVQDYSAAIENMLLAAVALGYQSCWFEGHITDEDRIGRKMADLLGVPEDYELVCFLPVGVAESEPGTPRKKPFGERAWFNGFPPRRDA
jgi:nitroreductase